MRRDQRRGIAIVGISGRYPGGADTPARLWENLKAGVDGVTEARGDRWDLGHHHPDSARAERVYTRACGLLAAVDGFDNEFFSISPREARQVDPQQRLLLELAWEALEDAAIPLDRIAGTDAGVFIGISSNDYAALVGPSGPDAYSNTGSAFSIAANRISYVLDLHGPSIAIDTACSSSIVGVHQACMSLLNGDCSVALAGGISLLLHIRPWIGFAKASMLSPTGRCKSFDASGDGYVRSEGGGVVVLKPLEDAERDGDSIYGVILASAVNSDGHTMGLSMPNVDAQERVLRKAYSACGIAPEDVVYVEAHGTGTAVGDPIECESLGRVLGTPRTDGSTLLIGSVKSNIGHLEAASGMAGLTKALLVLRHREVPGNLHFTTPNPKIKFDEWKLGVVTATTPLPERERPLVVGVNSFGFGGTNAHLAIQEYRAPHASSPSTGPGVHPDVLLLSAHTPAALKAVAAGYRDVLTGSDANWNDVCAAVALCRSQHRYRLAVAADSAADAVERLERFLAGESPLRTATGSSAASNVPVAFVFSGNGPQWWGMGRELMASDPVFRREIEALDAVFEPLAGWSLVAEMERPEADSRTALTQYAQPLLFALQVALTAVLRDAGIRPALTLGHSVGEVAAAYAADALTLEDAVRVIFYRSLHQAKTAGSGKMAAIGLSVAEAREAIKAIPGWLELAASNAPKAVTVAGAPDALEALRAAVTESGKFARVLPLQYPFHSTAMDVIKDDLLASLHGLATRPGSVPFISTVDAGEVDGTQLGADYWWRNVREPVRFLEAVDHVIAQRGIGVFLEIGPHPVLRDYVVQCAKARDKTVVALGTLRRPAANRPEPEADNLWTAICGCYANGAGNVEAVYTRPARIPVLPLYPWQRTPHWRGGTALPDTHFPIKRDHPLLGYAVSAGDGLWENTLDVNALPYLADHVVQGSIVFPAAGYIENGLTAAHLLLGPGTVDIEAFEILRPLTIPDHTDPLVQLAADAKDGTFSVSSRSDRHSGAWTQHVRGRLSHAGEAQPVKLFDPAALCADLPCRISAQDHYLAAKRRGLAYGPQFTGITNLWMSSPDAPRRTALAEIHLPSLAGERLAPYIAHPALTDSGVQIILSLVGQTEPRQCSVIPVFIDRIRSYAPVPNHYLCRVTLVHESERSVLADFDLCDPDGNLVLRLSGVRCAKVDFTRGSASSLIAEWWRPDPAHPAVFAAPLALPEPAALAAAIAGDVAGAARDFGREAFYRDIAPALDRLIGAYAARALAELGATAGSFTVGRLSRRGGVKTDRQPLLAALIGMAHADGQLIADGAGWVWNAAHTVEAPEPLWRALLLDHPRLISELLLAARAGDNLVATLRGETAPGEPAGIDALFDAAPFAAFYNRTARIALRSLVAAWPADRPIRIVEIGGAGGGLTAALLAVLPPHRTDYLFTDSSDAALGRAEHLFAHYGFVRFAKFDIGAEPGTQTLSASGFDLAIAGNTLRSADDIDAALGNVATLLGPGGQLLAIEDHPGRLGTLIFGGDPAWWEFADADVRGAARQLSAEGWNEALERAGFDHAAGGKRRDDGAGEAQQTVLLARKLGANAAARHAPVAADSRRWLFLAGPAEAGSAALSALTDDLTAHGQAVTVRVLTDGIALTEADALALLAGNEDAIVHFAGAGPRAAGDPPAPHAETRCTSALKIVQTLEATRHDHPPQLTFITNGALASPFGPPLNPGHAAVWGLVRVVANEHPGLGCRLIDLHADLGTAAAGTWLAHELLRRDAETEVQLNDGARYVNREYLTTPGELARLNAAPDAPPFRLDFVPQGGLDSLHLRAIERREPAAGEVEIRVGAAGLNFRDVLWAMGMLPEEAVEKGFSGPTIGMECAGEVVRVGDGVTGLRAGDRVVAFASSCFASHVTTAAGSVARIPATMTFEEAATIPIAFLTAYYALDTLARLAPGETVLVHGAAGGVGLAAVQIAKLKGARVIGTAGSTAKRRVLEMLGVDHVLNSRSLEFADDVMALTNGAGVDVVLNSLAGEAITKGLQILRPFGRFLEIGKRDLYANSRIGLRPFRQNLSYFGIDADTLLIERPELARQVFTTVMDLFAGGALRPIAFQSLPISRASEAFRTMQQSRHVGKIVVSLEGDLPEMLPIVRRDVPVRAGGTYLVTGGLNGFGLATAQWLVASGARSIALAGRRGAVTDEARAGIAAMESAGAVVRAFAADIGDPAAVNRLVETIRAEMAPLRGVVHSAAIIEDAPIMKLSDELLARVLEPKMRGAWNLHAATLPDELELFVLYSSSSVMVGNPGQGAYVAANLYLESLAQYRRALGLPALAVGWGAIKDAGFLTRNAAVADMLKNRSGLDATPAAEALAELGRLTAVGASRVCVARFNLERLGQMLSGARVPRFLPIIPQGIATAETAGESIAERLTATPPDERRDLMIGRIREHAGRVLGIGGNGLDVDRPLAEMGLDSLMAVELAEAVERDVARPISVMQMLGAGSIGAIADLVLRTLGPGADGGSPEPLPAFGGAGNGAAPAAAASNETAGSDDARKVLVSANP